MSVIIFLQFPLIGLTNGMNGRDVYRPVNETCQRFHQLLSKTRFQRTKRTKLNETFAKEIRHTKIQ